MQEAHLIRSTPGAIKIIARICKNLNRKHRWKEMEVASDASCPLDVCKEVRFAPGSSNIWTWNRKHKFTATPWYGSEVPHVDLSNLHRDCHQIIATTKMSVMMGISDTGLWDWSHHLFCIKERLARERCSRELTTNRAVTVTSSYSSCSPVTGVTNESGLAARKLTNKKHCKDFATIKQLPEKGYLSQAKYPIHIPVSLPASPVPCWRELYEVTQILSVFMV